MLSRIASVFKKKKGLQKPQLPVAPPYFDSDYYLATYADVAQAGMPAWEHFYHHGYQEGRWPCQLKAVQAEALLWTQATQSQAEQQLWQLTQSSNEAEKTSAAWFLARWHAALGQWQQVHQALSCYVGSARPMPGLMAPHLLWVEVLAKQKNTPHALAYLEQLKARYGDRVELILTRMNHLAQPKDHALHWKELNQHYDAAGLMGVCSQPLGDQSLFDGLQSTGLLRTTSNDFLSVEPPPLVSVIVPAYNAEKTILTTLKGLQAQTWSYLEILVVDDASSDNTAALVAKLALQDPRIRLIAQTLNKGAYHARNVGLAESQGQFITVHDSDDWSHPQKIEQQLRPLLQQPALQVTLSHWVRASDDLQLGNWSSPEDWNGLVHRNVSSLLMRRAVFNELGFWDDVVCSADTEYYYRVLKAYGAAAVYEVHPGLPLAFGRVREDSLTQRSATHIFTIFSGLRHDYSKAYHRWHESCLKKQYLYMPQHMDTRVFEVDARMLRRPNHS